MPTKQVKKPVAKKPITNVEIKVGRFGTDPTSVTVATGSTVEKVLQAAGINLETVEKVFLNGNLTGPESKVKKGDIVSIVSPKEAGL